MKHSSLLILFLSVSVLSACGGKDNLSAPISEASTKEAVSSSSSLTSSVVSSSSEGSSLSSSTDSSASEAAISSESSSAAETTSSSEKGSVSSSEALVYTSDGLHYTLDENAKTASVTSFDGSQLGVLVPAVYEGYPVTSIGKRAFANQGLIRGVSLPSSIQSIGQEAFSLTYDLRELNFPEGLQSIGANAFFYARSLSAIVLPSSLTSIDPSAFSSARGITSFSVASTNSVFASDGRALYRKSDHSLLFYAPNSGTSFTVPDDTLALNNFSFYDNTMLTSLTLNAQLTTIAPWALCYVRGLTRLSLPHALKSIGAYALGYDSALVDLHYEGTLAEWATVAKSSGWNTGLGASTILCTDGSVSLS